MLQLRALGEIRAEGGDPRLLRCAAAGPRGPHGPRLQARWKAVGNALEGSAAALPA